MPALQSHAASGHRSRSARLLALLALAAVMGAISLPAQTGVTLAWDRSSSTNVVGYDIYYGTTSGNYTNVIQVSNTNGASIGGLSAGTTYYFAAAAVDNQGLQSAYSKEISYTAQVPLVRLQMSVLPSKQVLLTGTGQSGLAYDILACRSLTNWTTIGQATMGSNGSFQFVDPSSTNQASSFYRLRGR